MTKAKDLTGQRFGRWTVLERVPLGRETSNGERHGWRCRCDCGTERTVVTRSLTDGSSRSCGCDIVEKATHRMQEDNVLGRFDGTVVSAIRPDRQANRNSKSGVKGVYWSEREGTWIAKIGVRGKAITLGRFARLEDAIKARQAAEDAYYAPILEAWEKGQAPE